MGSRKFELHNGQKGSALAIRITPRSRKNEVAGIMNDGTVKIRLTSGSGEQESNQALIDYLAQILNVPTSNVEIVAGTGGIDKLVSILELDAETVHNRILAQLA